MDYKTLWHAFTDMQGDEDCMSEMSKKYKETVIELLYNGQKLYGYYRGNNGVDLHSFSDIITNKILSISLFDTLVTYVGIPKIKYGCHNLKNGLVAISFKYAHRQWKKGLCKQNTCIVIPYLQNSKLDTFNNFNTYLVDVLSEDLQKEVTLTEAIQEISKGTRTQRMLTKDFFVSANFNSNDPNLYFLFYNKYIIGTIKEDEKRLTVENTIFLQEVLDNKQQWCADYLVVTP